MSPEVRPIRGTEPRPRRVLFLTGTRADFGKLKPLIARVAASPEFEYGLFVTGMHMLSRYGSTVNEIRKAGFDNIHTFINQDGATSGSQMDLVLATTIQGLGHYVREFPPDLIVVHGDRVETLAGAIVGALNNILVGHVEGGELSGTIDELLRHAVSKLSHLHFVANEEARTRLLQMGESANSVYAIGSPDIDVMLSDSLPSLDDVRARYEIPFAEYAITIYHPVTTELEVLERNTDAVVDAMTRSGRNFVVIYPNNDAGGEVILSRFGRLRGNPRIRLIPSMRFEYFLTALKHAHAILGNSSAGIREAPVYGVPTINVGTRQLDRFAYPSILNVPEDAQAIIAALEQPPSAAAPSLHFGDGRSAERFLERLRSPELWKTPCQKRFHDLPDPGREAYPSSVLALAGARSG